MEEPTELEMLVEELLQLNEELKKKSHHQTQTKKDTLEKERKQATETRERVMEYICLYTHAYCKLVLKIPWGELIKNCIVS